MVVWSGAGIVGSSWVRNKVIGHVNVECADPPNSLTAPCLYFVFTGRVLNLYSYLPFHLLKEDGLSQT